MRVTGSIFPEITSTTVDCNRTVRKNTPSHSHVISLMEHIMEANGAMIFHSYMQSLKQKCKLYRYPEQQENTSFPTVPPSCLEHCFVKKFEGHCIMKTPVWAIHHCLSLMKSVKKTYSIDISNTTKLSKVANGAYLICGYLNPECVTQ